MSDLNVYYFPGAIVERLVWRCSRAVAASDGSGSGLRLIQRSLPVLGIEHEYAGWTDHYVIDVTEPVRYVIYHCQIVRQLGQCLLHDYLAKGAFTPRQAFTVNLVDLVAGPFRYHQNHGK